MYTESVLEVYPTLHRGSRSNWITYAILMTYSTLWIKVLQKKITIKFIFYKYYRTHQNDQNNLLKANVIFTIYTLRQSQCKTNQFTKLVTEKVSIYCEINNALEIILILISLRFPILKERERERERERESIYQHMFEFFLFLSKCFLGFHLNICQLFF